MNWIAVVLWFVMMFGPVIALAIFGKRLTDRSW
jgi:hypothetical protein